MKKKKEIHSKIILELEICCHVYILGLIDSEPILTFHGHTTDRRPGPAQSVLTMKHLNFSSLVTFWTGPNPKSKPPLGLIDNKSDWAFETHLAC